MQARRILIVANQTAPGSHLKDIVRQRMDESPCTFVLLVPATPPRGKWISTDAEAIELAQQQMQRALEGLQGLGAAVEGRVEEGPPMDAIAAYMQVEGYEHHQPFDEIILSTLPPGVSRWLKQDLPHRLSSRYGIPVTHVIGEPNSIPSP
ncbi:MAG: hypothetical protein M3280_06995 [Actinomycetota bacterium]|nr:hypothetical protein [Actinomycetota bacterium]